MSINLNDRMSDDVQSLGELWQSLNNVVAGRVADNELCVVRNQGKYPLDIRRMQMVTIKTLIRAIEEHHEKATKGP